MAAFAVAVLAGCTEGRDETADCERSLEPRYLPEGALAVDLDPYIPAEERKLWQYNNGFIELAAGLFEDTAIVETGPAAVDGDAGSVGHLDVEGDPDAAPAVVAWEGDVGCGVERLAVSSNTVGADELVRIASSLER